MQKYLSILSLLIPFSGCVKDKPAGPVQQQVQLTSAKKVYVVNEGRFQTGTGTISLYDTESGDVIENFYEAQNNAQIGNIAQSLNYINGNYYIVVNNAGKIVVCDNQLKKTGQISGLTSPRYILPITNQKAYVTDLYANAISIVDLNTNLKTSQIYCYGKTEKMVQIYNKVFVTNTDRDYAYIINTLTDAIADSVFVGKNAGSIMLDKHDKVWILGSGESPASNGRLTKINAVTNQVEAFIGFGANELPNNLCLNKTRDTLYYLNDGIFRMKISDNTLPSSAFIDKGSKNFYGIGINPNDYTIYAADAVDYTQRSNIYIFDVNGTQKSFFKAGIISNGFYFE